MDHKLIKSYLFFIALFFLTINSVSAQYPGTNLRGQIKYLNPSNSQYYPLANVLVKLYYNPSEGQYLYMGETITNNSGIYFFYRIQPGRGNFYIQVNRVKNYPILVLKITYNNNQYNRNQFQDIPILYY